MMQKAYYQRPPYSFSRENHFNRLINHEKSCNEIQTNEQSDTSFDVQRIQSGSKAKSYDSLINSLTQEMEYHKEALKTAETLISNYQRQNQNLREENVRVNQQLNAVHDKLQNVERLLLKLFGSQKPSQVLFSQKNTHSSFYPMEKQNLKTFSNSGNQIQPDIYNKVSRIFQQQLKYEDQILQLNKKIKLLERNYHSDIKQTQKNKLKNSVYMPFTCNQTIAEEKNRIANNLIEMYENEKTTKTMTNKQSDFKKNLEKEFEVFLESKKTTVKSKSSILRTPSSHNHKSSQSISISTEKRNSCSKKSTSISKR